MAIILINIITMTLQEINYDYIYIYLCLYLFIYFPYSASKKYEKKVSLFLVEFIEFCHEVQFSSDID